MPILLSQPFITALEIVVATTNHFPHGVRVILSSAPTAPVRYYAVGPSGVPVGAFFRFPGQIQAITNYFPENNHEAGRYRETMAGERANPTG